MVRAIGSHQEGFLRSIFILGQALLLAAAPAWAAAQDLEPRYDQGHAAARAEDGRWGKEEGRTAALDLCSRAVSQQASGAGYARLGPVTQEIWKHWGFRIAGVFYIQSQAQSSGQPGPLRRGSYVCDTRDGQIERLKLHGY
jgi:hypothetical protein